MAKEEIKIDTYELKNYNGNLKSVTSAWHSMPKFTGKPMRISQGESFTGSPGGSAEHVNSTCQEAKKLKKTVGLLLDNTIGFFEALGISFVETDENAADAIGNRGIGSGGGSGGGHF